MGKFTQLLPILCDDCANIKMQQKTTHLHRYHASIVIKNLRAMNFFPDKIAAQFALFFDKFTQLTRILHDRRSHRSRQISTLLCPKTFANISGLNRHRQTHSGGKRYNCAQCNKSFSQNVDLKRHFLFHTGEKPHKCTQCNFLANDVKNLREHIMKHTGEKPNQCNQCDYTSTWLSSLKRHKR